MNWPSYFHGDGRESLSPPQHGVKVTRGAAQMLVRHFLETGQSSHSEQAATLWVIQEYCRLTRTPYHQQFVVINGAAGFLIRKENHVLDEAG